MTDHFEGLGYTQNEIAKLEAHIDDVLQFTDGTKINAEYRAAIESNNRQQAISALVRYYRSRPEFDMPDFQPGPYDGQAAVNGVEGKMRVVNIDHDFKGPKIDFLFNPTLEMPPVNHEWLWQLNRHIWWIGMACAYADTKEEKYAKAFNTQLLDWVVQTDIPEVWNAPGSAWRTLECGIRLMISWQVAFNLFRHAKEVGDETLLVMLGSMHKQAVHLANNPTGRNWLLTETSGLYNFGALFPEFTDAEQYRSVAYERIIEEMRKQVLPDGMQDELSPDYHKGSLNCAQAIYKTAMATGKTHEFPEDYRRCMYAMAMAAVKMSTPCFTQPRTNDCYTVFTEWSTEFSEQIFPDEPAFKYVNSHRREGAPLKETSLLMPWSGFAIMRSDWGPEATYLCFDVGPLGMGHWHQDKLNIILFKGNEELIFDDGGGQYEQSPERTYGLSSYDHNVVLVDGMGQTRPHTHKSEQEIDAGWITNETFDYAYGIYDEEYGGTRPATHKREVRFCKPSFYVVRDTLTSADGNDHVYELRFHMDTEKTKQIDNDALLVEYGKKWDLLIVPIADEGESRGTFQAYSAVKEPALLGWFIGRNAEKVHPATTVIMKSDSCKVHHFTNILIPFEHGTAQPTVAKEQDGTVSVTANGMTYKINLHELNK